VWQSTTRLASSAAAAPRCSTTLKDLATIALNSPLAFVPERQTIAPYACDNHGLRSHSPAGRSTL
jgi:hypothetical protein